MSCTNEDFCHPPLTDDEKDVVVILQSMKQIQFATNHSNESSNFRYTKVVKSLFSSLYNPLLWTFPSFRVTNNYQQFQIQERLHHEETATVDACLQICGNLDMFLQQPLNCLSLPFVCHVDGRNDNYSFYQMSLPYEEDNYQLKWEFWKESDQNKQFPCHPRKVTYAMNNDQVYITINDIYNALEFRLECLGFCVFDVTRLKGNVYSNLRPIKVHGTELHPPCPFLKALKKVGSSPMCRSQKCYIWSEVKHCHVFQRAAEYIFKKRRIGESVAVAVRQPAKALMECPDEKTFQSMLTKVAPVWMP